MKADVNNARGVVGHFIKTSRKSRGLTQQALADMVGVSIMTISKIESGKFNFGIDILSKIVIALGVQIDARINCIIITQQP